MNKNKSWFSITFEWNSLIKDLVKNIWVVALAAIIAFMGIQVYEKSIYTPTYTSSAILVVRAKVGSSGVYSNLASSSEMATIFTKVFQQPSMKKLAAENLGMASFDGTVSASVTGTTNLLNVTVKSENPELSFKLLTSVLEVYPNISDAIFSDAVIDVISNPNMPTSPSNSPFTTYRNQIILIAMAFAAALIVLFSLLRETVKEEKGFTDKIDSELLGKVSHEKPHISFNEKLRKKKRALLINDAYSTLRFTEDYQKLATKLEYMQKKKDKKVFAVTSVAENEGKSTVAANIALALSGRGYKVALIDLDVRKPSLYKIFDYRQEMKNEFVDVLSNKISLNEFAFYRHKKSDLIIAFNKKSYEHSNEIFSTSTLEACISVLREKMDFVIVDTPPTSVSADAVSTSVVADRTLLVVRTDTVAVQDVNDAILAIKDAGGKLAGCVLNDVYKPFTLFGQMGTDETGYYGAYYRGGYKKHYLSGGEGFTEDYAENSYYKIEE